MFSYLDHLECTQCGKVHSCSYLMGTCPEGAATLGGLKALLEDGFLGADETIVLLNTGSSYKYLHLFAAAKGV